MGIRRRPNLIASLRTASADFNSASCDFKTLGAFFCNYFSRGLLVRRIRRPWQLSRRRLRDSIPVLSDSNVLRGGKFPIGLPALRIRELWPLSRRRGSETVSPKRTVSRAPVYQMLWVRDFGDHTILGRGFNLFKPLRRHFRAGAGRRDKWNEWGSAPARFFPRFPSSRGFAQRKISPLVHRRRIRRSSTKLVGAALRGAEADCRTGLAGTLGHGGFLV
jgi:hypothetical protein